MVLAAGSHFFNDIFIKSDAANILIYLKGISSGELENVTDFMYNGEVFIAQEELTTFLETARELKVIGLQAEVQCMGQNEPEEKMSTAQNENYFSK